MDPATLNKVLEGRVKDLASMRRGSNPEDVAARKLLVLKALGLHPLPPKTDLKAMATGVIQREGYRIEKIRYESRPGLLVTAHLYLPEGQGPWPLIVSAHGAWKGKKSAPVCQARGISLALRGFAALIVDAPGNFGEDLSLDERGQMGAPGDPNLIMGAPWIGQYAWDLVRAVDLCLGRPDIDPAKIGITGEGDGGIAAAMAFVAEDRFACAALVCTASSLEQYSLESIAQLGIPGLALAGDFSDILAIRMPCPILLLAAKTDDRFEESDVKKASEKLQNTYKSCRASDKVRFEQFEGGHDYNRRMRETVAAFLTQHLGGQSATEYLPELRPLTDGAQNPYPAGTVPQDLPEMFVTDWQSRQTLTFQDVFKQNLAEPHPDPFRTHDRLVPWPKYGSLEKLESAVTLGLHDSTIVVPRATPSIGLPYELVDSRLAVMAGMSLPEFFAQILHLSLPGGPESWESQALGGDAISSMIASVKTLMKSSNSETTPTHFVAEGPVASLTALFLKLYRPSIQVDTSHAWSCWSDLLTSNIPQLIQPQARYLEWPF